MAPLTSHTAFRLAAEHGIELLRRIGRGGMGEVYLGMRKGAAGFEKPVVVKRVADRLAGDPAFTRALAEEAKLMVRLDHPNIVQVYDLLEADGEFLVLLEYVEGVSLRSIIATGNRTSGLPVPLILSVTVQLLRALEHAHNLRDAKGEPAVVIHCDVSPENVLVSRQGRVKLTDFGIARVAQTTSFTGTGEVRGKLRYVAPEQMDAGNLSPRTDVYSTGLVLYEMVALDTARRGQDTVALVAEATRGEPYGLPEEQRARLGDEIFDALSAIVAGATQPLAHARYRSAAAMAADLKQLAASIGVSLESDSAVLPHLHDLFEAGLLEVPRGDVVESAPGSLTRSSATQSLHGSSPLVLVVDDSEIARDALARALPKYGWRVETAENATTALDWLESHTCDAILADLNMPDLSGIELCSFLRSNPTHSHLPVILLTSESDSRRVVAGFGVGADDYVRKGVTEAEIAARLNAVVRRTRH